MIKKYQILLVLIFLSSCYKDEDGTQIIENKPEPKVEVDTRLIGKIIDPSGKNGTDHVVEVDGESYIVEDSHFDFDLVKVSKKGQSLKIEENGILKSMAYVLLKERDINYRNIYYFDDWNELNISSSGSSSITIGQDLELDLTGVRFLNGGQQIGGDISIFYGEVVGEEFKNQLGNHGLNSRFEPQYMNIEKTFYFEFKTSQGIIPSVDENAPLKLFVGDISDKGLFFFNEEDDKWMLVKEEFNTSLEITNAGLFAIADYGPAVFCEGNIDSEGEAVSYVPLQVENSFYNSKLRTTKNGNWLAYLPENEISRISISSACISNEHIEVDVIESELSNLNNSIVRDDLGLKYVSTTILDCQGDFISAEVEYTSNNEHIFLPSSESEGFWIDICSADQLDLKTFDELGEEIMAVGLRQGTDKLPLLTACKELKEGFTLLSINEEVEIYDMFISYVENNRLVFRSTNSDLAFFVRGTSAGIYGSMDVNMVMHDADFGENGGYYIYCENSEAGCGFDFCNISDVKLNGEDYFNIELGGNIWMQKLNPASASTFRLEGNILCKK